MVGKVSSEIRLSLRMEMALARASGSLEATITVILSILSDLDADNLQEAFSSQHGNAFMGKRDPVLPGPELQLSKREREKREQEKRDRLTVARAIAPDRSHTTSGRMNGAFVVIRKPNHAMGNTSTSIAPSGRRLSSPNRVPSK